ncbi:MAG: DUF5040 domain-containing protein, partial [Muribaculaceae bacterium]|nr:DUF5040 domain-containing protein [Muribaculaceae bacterium]
EEGVKESYFYVAECDDVDANTNAKSKTFTFTYFKNGTSSVSVTVEKTSIITLFWNGTYWETSVVPMNFDLNRLFKGTLYAKNDGVKLKLYSKYDSKNTAENVEFTSNNVGGELGSVWRVRGDAGGILISNYGTLSLITPRNMYLFEYSDDKGEKLESSSDDYKNGKGYWRKVTQCENLKPEERTKWNKAVTDLTAEIDNRKNAIEGLNPKLLKGEIYIGDEQNDGWKLYKDAEKTGEIGYQSPGDILKVKGFLGGIAIASSSRLIVLSPNRALYYTFNSNANRYDKTAEYKYVTNEEKSSWDKAVTDLTDAKNDIADLKKNPNSSVKYATSVSVPRGGFVFADGASFLARDKEEWLSSAMRELGLKHKSVAVGGENIRHTAYRLCKDTEYTPDDLEEMDVFLIQHVHNQDVFTLSQDSQDRTIAEYEAIINATTHDYAPLDYAEAFDYVIKKHMANCYSLKDKEGSKWYGIKSGKPMQMLLCTHWHDARTTYNESVRKLCAKWGIALCEMDINIGFATSGVHPVATYDGAPAQVSLLYAQKQGGGLGSIDESDTQETNKIVYGWHQNIGDENFNYLTRKMASILMRCFVVSNVIEWSSSFNMNDYKTQGVYFIKGERLYSEFDNLPIRNAASGHSISGEFTVLDASLSEEEKCITQYLKLSNRLGREGKEYIRTYNRFKDGREEWSLWRELKGTLILDQISDEQLKSYTENGVYEGVIFEDLTISSSAMAQFLSEIRGSSGSASIPNGSLFSMEVFNNYAIVDFASANGVTLSQSITQKAKVVIVNGTYVEVQRTSINGTWSGWQMINLI